jgi:ATP-dependent Clp protease adapter protein ClpS
MEGFVPAGFSCGMELMNDNLTPTAFVVSVLKTCVGLSEADAIRTMLDIHRKGGILLPMHSFEESSRVAELVTTEARRNSHPLYVDCRNGDRG